MRQRDQEKIQRKIKIDTINKFTGLKLNINDKMVQQLADSLAMPKIKEFMDTKSPAGWIKSLSNVYTWSNREMEWYDAEERLLFACITEDECDRWVCMLNWAISKQR